MICLALCPFQVGSFFVVPWFIFWTAVYVIAQHIFYKMLHLLLWDITSTQQEYSNYLLVISPISCATGACIGLLLALLRGDFLVIAILATLGSFLVLALILNSFASDNERLLGLHSAAGDLNNTSEVHLPLIPSIRLVVSTKEFKRLFKVVHTYRILTVFMCVLYVQ
jgi:hypothetical protein